MVHDFVYGKLARDGTMSRQVTANYNVQMSYDENILYSYRTKLAEIDRDSKTIILYEDTRGCSNTSREHFDDLERAIPSYYTVYYSRQGTTKDMIKHNLGLVDDLIDKQSRVRVADYKPEIIERIDNLYNYLSYLKYDKRKAEYRAIKTSLDLINLAPGDLKIVRVKANKKLRLTRKAKQRKRDLANLEYKQRELSNFLGETVTKYDVDFVGVRLKIKDDFVYTSNYIRLPLKECLVLYKRHKQGKKILGLKLNQYKILKLNKETVTIGCTTISHFELNRVFSEVLPPHKEVNNTNQG